MRGITHVLLTYTLTTLALDPAHAPIAALGSLLPDLDHPDSLASQPLRRTLGREAALRLSRTLGGHRGPLHSPYPWTIATLALALTGHHRAATLPLGALLHVTQDALTTMGVPVSGKHRVALTPIPSDEWDALLLPATLILLPTLWLLDPSTFPAPAWEPYWATSLTLDSTLIHGSTYWEAVAARMNRYGYLPAGTWVTTPATGKEERIRGILTPEGWILTDHGRWVRPHPDLTLEDPTPVRRKAEETITHGDPPAGSLILEGLVELPPGRDPTPALIRGFHVLHSGRSGTLLECHGLSQKVFEKIARDATWHKVLALCPR